MPVQLTLRVMAANKTSPGSFNIILFVAAVGLLGAFRPALQKLLNRNETAGPASTPAQPHRQEEGAASSTHETQPTGDVHLAKEDGVTLEFRICTACAFKGQYQRDRAALEAGFPGLATQNVFMKEYDVGTVKRFAAQAT